MVNNQNLFKGIFLLLINLGGVNIALNWMKEYYQIQKCLSASVFRCELGDCTNRGILSKAKRPYILGVEGPFYPGYLRTCVTIQCHEALDT